MVIEEKKGFASYFELAMLKIDHLSERIDKHSVNHDMRFDKLEHKMDSVIDKQENDRKEFTDRLHQLDSDYREGLRKLWVKVATLGAISATFLSLAGGVLIKFITGK